MDIRNVSITSLPGCAQGSDRNVNCKAKNMWVLMVSDGRVQIELRLGFRLSMGSLNHPHCQNPKPPSPAYIPPPLLLHCIPHNGGGQGWPSVQNTESMYMAFWEK